MKIIIAESKTMSADQKEISAQEYDLNRPPLENDAEQIISYLKDKNAE